MTSFSKSANACGVHSAGENMDELTIACYCRIESPKSQTVRASFSKSTAKSSRCKNKLKRLLCLQKVSAELNLRKSGPQTVCLPAARSRTHSE
jgi:hypothetical protein